MKIYKNNYRDHWLSPYTILEKVFFWREIDYDEPIINRFKNVLMPFCTALHKVLNIVHPKIDYVKIDRWDTWSMDSTLSPIIYQMLKQLNASKHGAPHVDDEDVPEELRSTAAPTKENEWDVDDNHFARWDWVMAQMVWSFKQLSDADSAHDQFSTGVVDVKLVASAWDAEGKPTLYTTVNGPNHTSKFDIVGWKAHQEKIAVGLKLFGKYYQSLWD